MLAGALLLTSCGSPSDQPSSGGTPGTLVVADGDQGETLDPAVAFAGWYVNRNGIAETLIDVDEQLNLIPKLATEWTNLNQTTWRLTLREGVSFHNGKPMDAEAVKAAIEYSIKTNVRAESQLPIASMTAEGNVLTIATSRPLAALPHILADPMMSIQALGEGIDPATMPIGTGPFKVSEFAVHERVELDANQQYWAGVPKLAHVTVKMYADLQARGLALQSGEADVVVQPEAAGLSVFSDTGKYRLWQVTSTRADGVILNTASPVLSDLKVRQAVDFAVNRDAYKALMQGMGVPAYTVFPENVVFGGSEGLQLPVTSHDLAKAKQLLLDAGYTESNGQLVKDGKQLRLRLLTYPARPELGRMAQLLQSDLAGIGVSVEISEIKSTADTMKAGDFDLGMYSLATAPTGDSEYFFDTFLRSTAQTNYSHWNSPEFDAALDKLSTTFDVQDRLGQSRAVEQVMLNETPYFMYGHRQWWVVSNVGVSGLHLLPTEYHMLTHETAVG